MNKKTILAVLLSVAGLGIAVFFLAQHKQSVPNTQSPASTLDRLEPVPISTGPQLSANSPNADQIANPNYPKANWTKYEDNAFLFGISYPPSSTIEVSAGGLDEHNQPQLQNTWINFVQQVDPNVGAFQDQFSFAITVYDNPSTLTAKQWALKTETDIRKEENIVLGPLMGYKLQVFQIDRMSDTIYFAQNARLYRLSYWDPKSMSDFTVSDRNHYAEVFDEMVRSFQIKEPITSKQK